MKSSKELQAMLASEICTNLLALKEAKNLDCYNEITGDSSFLLSGILERELEADTKWSPSNWIDDSLLHKVSLENSKIKMWGVMIWGKEGTTKQWTEPFYCEFSLGCKPDELQELVILFGDEMVEEMIYEEFAENRTFWDKDFYSDTNWKPSERNWKYIIHSNKFEKET
jgi:hypothetical protein